MATTTQATDQAKANKELVKEFMYALHKVRDTGDTSILNQYLAPDLLINISGFPPNMRGVEQYAGGLSMFLKAFPDLEVLETFPMLAQGDTVATRVTWTGTHTGDLMGIPATGKRVKVVDMHVDRLANGKITERFAVTDSMGLMQQLGVIPAPEQAA